MEEKNPWGPEHVVTWVAIGDLTRDGGSGKVGDDDRRAGTVLHNLGGRRSNRGKGKW